MNKCLYPAKTLFLGLLTCQVIATIQVYLSNTGLYCNLMNITSAGYLAIPNQHVRQSLIEISPALCGGLFFTLSVGAGLSLISLAGAWIWDRLFSRKTIFLLLFLVPWMAVLVKVNLKGFCPIVTTYFLLIPIIVFVATLRWMPAQAGQGVWLTRIVHLVSIIVLASLWVSQMDSHLFINLRDHLLLSNGVGTKINDFYYKYTLYPAEVFKSLDQKTLKTCSLERINKKTVAGMLEKELHNHDYLSIKGNTQVDLIITEQDGILSFKNRGKTILRTPLKDFFSRPANRLREISSITDRYGFFRQFTFYSLLIGFPITLYVIFSALFCSVFYSYLDFKTSSIIAASLCFLAGVTLLFFSHPGETEKIQVKDLPKAMASGRWQDRIAALRLIQQKRMEIGKFQIYQRMLKSPHIAERYWLANALGVSRQPDTYKDLLILLDDLHPNVVCMAFHALGQRGNKKAITEILKRIETSDHWYEQWYAYRALRTLGWKQAR